MSLSKEDILAALKKDGISNLDDLAKAAADAKAGTNGLELSVFVHHSYVYTS